MNSEEDDKDPKIVFEKDCKDIKKSIKINQGSIGTIVYAVAVKKDLSENKILEISNEEGIAIDYLVYNKVKDVYHVSGVSYHYLGLVPVNYSISIENDNWTQVIPLPFSLIKRYMKDYQKVAYENWKSAYKSKEYEIQYIQMLRSY